MGIPRVPCICGGWTELCLPGYAVWPFSGPLGFLQDHQTYQVPSFTFPFSHLSGWFSPCPIPGVSGFRLHTSFLFSNNLVSRFTSPSRTLLRPRRSSTWEWFSTWTLFRSPPSPRSPGSCWLAGALFAVAHVPGASWSAWWVSSVWPPITTLWADWNWDHQLDEHSHFNCDQGCLGPLELWSEDASRSGRTSPSSGPPCPCLFQSNLSSSWSMLRRRVGAGCYFCTPPPGLVQIHTCLTPWTGWSFMLSLSLQHFFPLLQGRCVQLFSDNTTVISCIFHQGTLHLDPLMLLSKESRVLLGSLHLSFQNTSVGLWMWWQIWTLARTQSPRNGHWIRRLSDGLLFYAQSSWLPNLLLRSPSPIPLPSDHSLS